MTSGLAAPPSEAASYWNALLAQVRQTMAGETFDSVLRGSKGVSLEGHTLTVEVWRPGALPWLNERLMPSLVRVAHVLLDPRLKIVFIAQRADAPDDPDPTGAEEVGPNPGAPEDGEPEIVEAWQEPQPDEPRQEGDPKEPQGGGAPQAGDAVATGVREQHALAGAETRLVFTDLYIF